MNGLPPRPSLLRTTLLVAAGFGALVATLGLAASPAVSPDAQMTLGICGFAAYVGLVGPALDRRFRLDRQWKNNPPDLGSFRNRRVVRERTDLAGASPRRHSLWPAPSSLS